MERGEEEGGGLRGGGEEADGQKEVSSSLRGGHLGLEDLVGRVDGAELGGQRVGQDVLDVLEEGSHGGEGGGVQVAGQEDLRALKGVQTDSFG